MMSHSTKRLTITIVTLLVSMIKWHFHDYNLKLLIILFFCVSSRTLLLHQPISRHQT